MYRPMKGNPDSSIREIFACRIGNPGRFCSWHPESWVVDWNPEYSSRNRESHQRWEFRIQVLLKNTGIQYLESGLHSAWNPESKNVLDSLTSEIYKTSLKFYVYYTEYARLFKTVCTNKMHFRTHVRITPWWESEATN